MQILANLVMETLHSDLRDAIGPRLKGKMQQKQRSWMLVSSRRRSPSERRNEGPNRTPLNAFSRQISDAVYKQVLCHTVGLYKALVEACEARSGPLDARLRTDMDQIITSKEHVTNKIKGREKDPFFGFYAFTACQKDGSASRGWGRVMYFTRNWPSFCAQTSPLAVC